MSLIRDKLLEYFGGAFVSTNQIIEWPKEYKYVSVHAVDPLMML